MFEKAVSTVLHGAAYARLLVSTLKHPPSLTSSRAEPSSERHVLLVPGFLGSRAVLGPLEKRFVRIGVSVSSLNTGLYSACSFGITKRLLEQKIRRLRNRHPALRRLDIVAHSMGGLVAHDIVGSDVVHGLDLRLVTLGSPFRGTWMALAGCLFSPSAAELLPIHPRYRRADPSLRPSFPFLCIAGGYDVLAPPERCFHPGAELLILPVDHAGLLLRKDVFLAIASFLDAP